MVMVSDQDTYRAAEELIRNHADKAAMEGAELADRWEARGQPEAAELWRAIKEISHQRPISKKITPPCNGTLPQAQSFEPTDVIYRGEAWSSTFWDVTNV
jgi:hypothetical protein